MSRVTSLTNMPDEQLNRWIKRIALLFVLVLVAFVAFYAFDRFRAPTPSIADRQITQMEEAVRANPDDLVSRGTLGDLYVAAGRYDEAITLYTQIIDTGKEQRPAYAGRGLANELKGDLAAAKGDYQKVIDLLSGEEMAVVDSTLARAYYGLGSIALQEEQPADAVANLEKALRIKRTDADTLNLLGLAYVRAGTPEKAIDPLEAAILFVPVGWAQPYQTLGEAYTATGASELGDWASAMALAWTGDTTGARSRLEPLVDGAAGLNARLGLGLVAEQGGDSAAAADWYRRALELDSENRAASMGLSRVTSGSQSHPSIAVPSPSSEGSN